MQLKSPPALRRGASLAQPRTVSLKDGNTRDRASAGPQSGPHLRAWICRFTGSQAVGTQSPLRETQTHTHTLNQRLQTTVTPEALAH